ncbi:MAG TPA: ATP-binding protein, partial [Candidatus Kapabacteria bacterium]|nr:ATP-binding protein [Candidatus Kapabacteria bacterium]
MRLKSIYAQNVPPVKLFQINDLSDVVIIAGPNGVGKSRLLQSLLTFVQNPTRNTQTHNFKLIVEATCKEESQSWGKSFLDTTNNADAELLKETLQQNKRRGHWKSGVLFFESDRSLQQVQPFAFTWEFADPYEENIGWNSTFGGIKSRYQDTVHSIFKIIEHQKRGIANMAIRLKSEGKTAMNLEFEDPIAIFKDAFSQLLSPKKLLNPSAQTQQLEYEYQGKTFNISNLSSGEREVVNIVFDFLLRKPDNCIVVFDEPELHLHPELSYKLIQTLKSVGENNQFIFCTHSPDLISSSL